MEGLTVDYFQGFLIHEKFNRNKQPNKVKSILMPKVKLSRIIGTPPVKELIAKNEDFKIFIGHALQMHCCCLWGQSRIKDMESNKRVLESGRKGCVISAYDELPEFPKVWVITAEDHSSTMVSFRRNNVEKGPGAGYEK